MRTNNDVLQNWIDEMAALCLPDTIVWVDGSDEQLAELRLLAQHVAPVLHEPAQHRCRPFAGGDMRSAHDGTIATRRREDAPKPRSTKVTNVTCPVWDSAKHYKALWESP